MLSKPGSTRGAEEMTQLERNVGGQLTGNAGSRMTVSAGKSPVMMGDGPFPSFTHEFDLFLSVFYVSQDFCDYVVTSDL